MWILFSRAGRVFGRCSSHTRVVMERAAEGGTQGHGQSRRRRSISPTSTTWRTRRNVRSLGGPLRTGGDAACAGQRCTHGGGQDALDLVTQATRLARFGDATEDFEPSALSLQCKIPVANQHGLAHTCITYPSGQDGTFRTVNGTSGAASDSQLIVLLGAPTLTPTATP